MSGGSHNRAAVHNTRSFHKSICTIFTVTSKIQGAGTGKLKIYAKSYIKPLQKQNDNWSRYIQWATLAEGDVFEQDRGKG